MASTLANIQENNTNLRTIFGKAAAVVSLIAAVAFYIFGFQLGLGYYNQWQDNKDAAAIEMVAPDQTGALPWAASIGTFGVSLAAGFTGIAMAKERRSSAYSGSTSYSSYSSSGGNDNFWLGYWLGSSSGSSSSSSSSSSSDNGGAAAAIVIVGVAAAAATAGIVSYKAMKANFG